MNKESKILIAITVATILALVGGSFFFSKKDSNPAPQEARVFEESVVVGEKPFMKGSDTAKITIVEFADFECPACAASSPITKALMEEYNDKVKFVFRHFPLEQHKNAYAAAQAAEAAGAQGKFWEMHDKIFETQDKWAGKDDSKTQFESFAKELGLNMDDYKKAIAEKSFDQNIQKDLTDGTAVGVNSTPTFFINGVKLTGLYTLEGWKNLLDERLK